MNTIPLDTRAAYTALREHIAWAQHRVTGPFTAPDWLTRGARPLAAWQAEGPQPHDRTQPRRAATLYAFEFVEPLTVGLFIQAGYVLVICGGGSWTVNWWQGSIAETAAYSAALQAVGQ